jgi:hypothetical protein
MIEQFEIVVENGWKKLWDKALSFRVNSYPDSAKQKGVATYANHSEIP